MFTLNDCNHLSIADLAQLSRDGYSVMRTPHAGNLYAANLAVGSAGIRLLLVDRVFGRKDLLYHPNLVIKGGASEKLCSDLILMTRARIDHDSRLLPEVQRGTKMATVHLRAIRGALRESKTWVKLWTSYLESHKEFVLEVLERVSQKHPEIWYRRTDENGLIVEKLRHGESPRGGWAGVKDQLYGLTHPTSGWLSTNAANVFLNACIEARESGRTSIYHLGGVDMAGYMKRMAPLLSSYLESAQQVDGVPAHIEYHLGTITAMRYVGPLSAKEAIDALFKVGQVALQFEETARREMSKEMTKEVRHQLVGEYSEARKSLHRQVKEAVANVPSVTYNVKVPQFFSQYDALDGMYVHQQALKTPLCDLELMWQYIQRHTRKM